MDSRIDQVEAQAIDFKPENAVCVLQHEYAVTDAKSDKFVLGTTSASPCVILSLYDEKNKIAFLAHIDANTDIDSMQSIILMMDIKYSVAYIYGGDKNELDHFDKIKHFVEKNNIRIIDAVPTERDKPASFALNARTGKIYTSVRAEHLADNVEEVVKRSQMLEKKNEERINLGRDRAQQFIRENLHLNEEVIRTMINKLNSFPLDEAYNGRSFFSKMMTHNWMGIFSNYFSTNKSSTPGSPTTDYKKK